MSTETTNTASAPSATTDVPTSRYAAVTFDCPDPAVLGRFYGEALGLPVVFAADHFVLLGQEGAAGLGFNRLPDYRPPAWPGSALPGSQEKQAHLEIGVDDLETAEARLLALGAVRPEFQPDPERWLVLLDPAGHPFCVSTQV